jgi:molybdopterin molybdotransferase
MSSRSCAGTDGDPDVRAEPGIRMSPRASVDEHAAHIASVVAPALSWTAETVPVEHALGRVTAGAIVSPVDLPLFRNSQMDGFAARAADLPGTLRIAGEIAARPVSPEPLEPGTAVRIMTGAVVPEGADAVVPVEVAAVDGDHVSLPASASGTYVRERGSDLRAGDELLPGGIRLASRHLAVLAATGLTEVAVRSRPRLAIITTGAELIEPGATPSLGQVFDSNGPALDAACRTAGAIVASRTHVPDDPSAFLAALTEAAAHADLVVTSGGISMGDHEVVREVLEPRGARVTTIAMQPGGPQATAVFDGVPVVCFPGNPVSTQVSFEVFLAPLLRSIAGIPAPPRVPRALTTATPSVGGKRQFLRGRAVDADRVELAGAGFKGGASSHLVAGLAAADVLIDIPADVTRLEAGDIVETWAL